ncbi:MAG: hypothetical protein NUV51_01110 [Sulfuricaulis sp.]|nr:hypothetical protein [Sulfuricaulis sp.]
MKVELSPFDQLLRCVRSMGAQMPEGPNYAAYDRFMAMLPADASPDEYVRFKHVAAAAAGVLVGYGERAE